MKNTKIFMFLVKAGPQKQFNVLFKMIQNKLDILVVIDQNQNQKQRLFKYSLDENFSSTQWAVYFESIKEIYDFFKSQDPQTLQLKLDSVENVQEKKKEKLIDTLTLTYQIPVGLKKKNKVVSLTEQTNAQFIAATLLNISEFQDVEIKKANIAEKKKKVKQLKNQISKLIEKNKSKDQEIEKTKKITQQIKKQILNKVLQIKDMREQYSKKNTDKYHQIQRKKQGTVFDMKNNQNQVPTSDFNPSASVIYEAMPDSYELCPLGKHVQIHNGKRNLFLKQKQITNSHIQSMINFDWSEIEVLSFGANKITNKGIQLFQEISDFQKVTELYLFGNPITNITKIKFLGQLVKLSFYDLNLDEASCDHIIKTNFPNLKELYLDFELKLRQKCWTKIVNNELKNFEKLQSLHIDHPESLTQETKQKLKKLCQQKNISCHLGNPNIELQNCIIY